MGLDKKLALNIKSDFNKSMEYINENPDKIFRQIIKTDEQVR
jgi:hypothetical protein